MPDFDAQGELAERADEALYAAKLAGRDRTVGFDALAAGEAGGRAR